MKVTKRDTKRILKLWNGSIVKEKYNVVYLNCLLNDIGIGYIAKEIYNNSSISDFFKLKFTRDEYEDIKRTIWGLADYPEFHTEEDDKFIKRLPFNAKSNVDDIFKMQYHDTGLDIIFCMKSDSIKGVMENLDKIREMHDRWRDAHYEASPKYVASNSNTHAYQLESSYEIMSDD